MVKMHPLQKGLKMVYFQKKITLSFSTSRRGVKTQKWKILAPEKDQLDMHKGILKVKYL